MKTLPLAFVAALVLACDSGTAVVTCHGIPANGCPVQGGVECQDPSCAAAYTCQPDGGWALDHTCPGFDASTQDAFAMDTGATDAGYDIDAPPGAFGGPGCVMLQPPDCPLGEVLLCNGSCCGCMDLYVCSDGGWNLWGTCTDAGPVM
jgi:hypothetical protein